MTNTFTFKQALPIALHHIGNGIPVYLRGSPGIGKSDFGQQICDKLAAFMTDMRLAYYDQSDLQGMPTVQTVEGELCTLWARPGNLPKPGDGRRHFLFLDELSNASLAVQGAAYQLILERKIGPHKLPDDCVIMAAGNKASDRAAANRLSSALADRFAILDIEPDLASFCEWCASHDVHPAIPAFHRLKEGALLHDMTLADGERELTNFPTPRGWARVANCVNAEPEIRLPLIASIVGQAAAGEFVAFTEVWDKVRDLRADIIANPDSAYLPGPDEPGIAFAITTGLARAATAQNFDAIMRYGKRLPVEYGMVIVTDATARDETLRETDCYIRWSCDNSKYAM